MSNDCLVREGDSNSFLLSIRILAFSVALFCTMQTLVAQTVGDLPRQQSQPAQVQADTLTSGFAGGITSNDFQPLMDLIQSVVEPDTWQDNGGEGALIDYPAGVYADAATAVSAASRAGAEDLKLRLSQDSKLRTISLNRLEEAISAAAISGRPLSDDLKNLAGIYRVEFVYIDAQHEDVLIAGPAGPWRTDTSGRVVNVDTGLPTLQLDDLVVCLINAFHNDGKFGCTIIPKPAALAAANKFISTTKGAVSGRKWRESLRSAVGKQDIVVHGVSPDSGVANTIVEADVLMKKLGMGVEPSIDSVPSYFDRVKEDPTSSSNQTLIRWWFTMAYDSLVKDSGNRIFQIDGNSVKVLSENELLDQHGQRVHTGVADEATAGFAADFTAQFDHLAREHSVFASLKNVFDLALVANIVRRYDSQNRDRWKLRYGSQSPVNRRSPERTKYQLVSFEHSADVDSIMNFETFSFRERGKRFRRTIVGVSGGVEFDFARLISTLRIDEQSQSRFPRTLFGGPSLGQTIGTSSNWWWD